ncbi:hypothetical protein C0993_012740 [Termitomyces sp. T159_Od127]|nr:hypothetical protein C0993_012740 [Termitomyces sp. T159_Od127]
MKSYRFPCHDGQNTHTTHLSCTLYGLSYLCGVYIKKSKAWDIRKTCMMRLTFELVFFVATCLAAPSPRSSHHVVHETRAVDPIDWQITRRLENDQVLPMRFGLRQQNLDRIEEMLLAVSHPESPSYGKHWTPSEVVDTFAPSDDTITAVANWLTDAGIARERLRLSVSKGWLDLNATVEEVEDLLKTEYHVYSHLETGDEQIGAFLLISSYGYW